MNDRYSSNTKYQLVSADRLIAVNLSHKITFSCYIRIHAFHKQGHGVEQNETAAINLFKLSAEQVKQDSCAVLMFNVNFVFAFVEGT